jgi:hypothetical protein
MWLQGGPGAPSTYGMFTEIGPVIIGSDGVVLRRNHTWNNKYGLLVVDNPAGVGFSRLGDLAKPVATETQVGLELTSFLTQFVAVFPELKQPGAGIFIAGESYGGKYAPAATWSVHQANLAAAKTAQIPLRGMIIGDGWCDPASHVPAYAGMLRGMGLLDTPQFKAVTAAMARSSAKIAAGDFVGAIDGWNTVWGDYGGDYPNKSFQGKTLFENFTGGSNTENVWFSDGDPNIPNYGLAINWLGQPAIRKAIHIGNLSVGQAGLDQYAAPSILHSHP